VIYFSSGFAITIFSAIRLAKFNIDIRQKQIFYGLPTPAAALIVASIPLIIIRNEMNLAHYFENKFILWGITALLCYLMVSGIPMLSLKLKSFKFEENQWLFGLSLLCLITAILGLLVFQLTFLVVPVVITLYIVLSIIKNISEHGI
jgi:CDP-diacylglycerol--serine O-phosphatidyltransferase